MAKSRDFRRQTTVSELISDTRKPPVAPETGWYVVGDQELAVTGNHPRIYVSVPFQNFWDNVGSSHAEAGWYMDEGGEVRFRGRVTGGAAGTVIFTLPEEVRPEYTQSFVCALIGGGTANVEVYPDGSVYLESFN